MLTGKPPADLSIPALPSQAPPPASVIGLPSALLERRPDVRTDRNRHSSALPVTDLECQRGFANCGPSGFSHLAESVLVRRSAIGRAFLDAGKRRAQVKVTQASYDATVANYRQTVLTAFQQVEDSLAQLRILSQEAQITDRAVKSAQRSLDISTIQYRGGLANYLQIITANQCATESTHSSCDVIDGRLQGLLPGRDLEYRIEGSRLPGGRSVFSVEVQGSLCERRDGRVRTINQIQLALAGVKSPSSDLGGGRQLNNVIHPTVYVPFARPGVFGHPECLRGDSGLFHIVANGGDFNPLPGAYRRRSAVDAD
jgi:hypothetical protein